MPQLSATVADWAPRLSRGRYLSVFQSTWTFAKAAAPLLFLPLRARLGDGIFWPVLAVALLPAAFLLLTSAAEDRLRRHGSGKEIALGAIPFRLEA